MVYNLLVYCLNSRNADTLDILNKSTPVKSIKNTPYLASNGFAFSTWMDSAQIFGRSTTGEDCLMVEAKHVR